VRLAWFTPWPPQKSGVAGRSAEVTAILADLGWGIDVTVDDRVVSVTRGPDEAVRPGERRVQSAHDYVWRQARGQYDLTVYQVGNSRHQDFLWPYLFRWPGLVVLHDARLHHARSRRLLRPGGRSAYREEFRFNHPDVAPELAELAVHGFDGPYYADWPMTRAVVLSARAVACHSRIGAAKMAEDWPDRLVGYLPLGEGRPNPVDDTARTRFRDRLGAGPDSLVFGVFGGLSPDKRVEAIFDAFAALRRQHPSAHLWLGGSADPRLDLPALLSRHQLEDAVTHLDDPDDEAFDQAIAAVDVSLNLRWPSALETSGPWLRALAAARPTIVIELAHQTDVPAWDPRDWRPRNPLDARQPATIAIDILDERHSLGLAMDRLAADPGLRLRLGQAGRAYWEGGHTPSLMADGYDRLLRQAMAAPIPVGDLPPALRPDPWHNTRALAESFGITRCELP
jgi:glycosyltransferase involved in cell wall biosynthesis